MKIDANFDGGNIELFAADNPNNIQLKIKKDSNADYMQWFYFRATHVKNISCRFKIINAAQASYPEAWADGSIVASYDRQSWFRIKTKYAEGELFFSITPEKDIIYFALNPPYSYEQHQDLICWALQQSGCSLHDSIYTVQKHQAEILQIGLESKGKKKIWIIARQHPAETMTEWFMEGLIRRLLKPDVATSLALLGQATFYLVPNMNPDGSIAGYLRTNAAGVDLNRAWENPSRESSPEIFFVKEHMKNSGVDIFLDIHGDEEFPYVFAAGCEGNPGYTNRQAKLDKEFREEFHKSNPDFRTENGYPPDPPGEADLSIACNQIGELFDCLSLTIEMPFKDNKYLPDKIHGWSCQRSKQLGASVLDPIYSLIGELGNKI